MGQGFLFTLKHALNIGLEILEHKEILTQENLEILDNAIVDLDKIIETLEEFYERESD